MHLRAYTPKDKQACLALFDSNTPAFFAPSERADFAGFLAKAPDHYFVVEDTTGTIIACGGYYIYRIHTAYITWLLVARNQQRRGLGWLLLCTCLQQLSQLDEITQIRLHTSQHVYGFYEKAGFAVEKTIPDGFAPGLDRYDMTLPFDSQPRQRFSYPPKNSTIS